MPAGDLLARIGLGRAARPLLVATMVATLVLAAAGSALACRTVAPSRPPAPAPAAVNGENLGADPQLRAGKPVVVTVAGFAALAVVQLRLE